MKIGVNNTKSSLPAYIPYIGKNYFAKSNEGRRIIAIALSQNIDPNKDWAIKLQDNWINGDGKAAIDRMNIDPHWLYMHPFDTGHIPILCGILHSLLHGGPQNKSVYDMVCATNLSKFSFRSTDGRTTRDFDESLQRCWEWFSIKEIEILKPDYILCASQKVAEIVRAKCHDKTIRIIEVAFPGLKVINRHFGKSKGTASKGFIQQLEKIVDIDLDHRVDPTGVLSYVLSRDAYYFEMMLQRIKKQL